LVETGFAGYPELEAESVHLSRWGVSDASLIDEAAEERMEMAQRITSMVLSLRKKSNIRVRQPLSKIMVPVMDSRIREQLEEVKLLILNETNVKHLEYVGEDAAMIVKKIRPDFKALGPKFGKMMKEAAARLQQFSASEINELQKNGEIALELNGEKVMVSRTDVEILTEDIPGWLVAAEGAYTVALDVTLDASLKEEGLARELVNKIQNLRKTSGLEVTDRIDIIVKNHPELTAAVENNKAYICAETLGNTLELSSVEEILGAVQVELTEELTTQLAITKTN
jgi:isoleucyl-tRNA synthetase